MTRWHKPTCKAPLIVVQKGTPWCKTCGAAPDLKGLILQQKTTSPFTPPPRDEPLGQLNLYWPPSVPYVTTAGTKPATKPNGPAMSNGKLPISPVYPSRLAPDEFRLIALSAPLSIDDPIHIDLEVYKNERCPEYEATSYTWAGENGDGSFTMPIYIGPWWDVLIQTKNCWSMLRLMRPLKGCRMIWVDAICINQNDISERDAQVSKMSQIYSACRSVYLYLGATPTTQLYPLRRQLQLTDGKPVKTPGVPDYRVDLAGLLQKRYFSRMWVVQELILSRQAVFQLGDVEYWMNSSTIRSISSSSPLKWEQTKAPWLEYLGQQTFNNQGLFKTLRAVSKSQCTDPRDKIFGIMALVGNNPSSGFSFQANYGISCQHMFFGVFAYALLNMRNIDVLRNAAAIDAAGQCPSWMPNWKAPGPNWIFKAPEMNIPKWQSSTFEAWWAKLRNREGTVFLNVSGGPAQWKTEHEIESDRDRLPSSDLKPGQFTLYALRQSCSAYVKRPWFLDATVNSANGTLGINLIRLLTIPSVPEFVQELSGLWLFKVQAPVVSKTSRPVSLYLTTTMRLDKYVKPGRDHVFILDEGNSSCLFLVLREAADGKTFTLLTCCYHASFQSSSEYLPASSKMRSVVDKKRVLESQSDKDSKLSTLLGKSVYLNDLQISLHETLQSIDISQSIYRHGSSLCRLFLRNQAEWQPGAINEAKVMLAFQGIFNDSRGSKPGFIEAYLACVDPRFAPKLRGDYVEVTVQSKDRKLFNKDCTELYAEWGYNGKDWAKGSKWLDAKDAKPVLMRASHAALRDAARHTTIFKTLSKVSPAARKTRQDEVTMARRGPHKQLWEDHFVALPRWPADIVSDFKIDGSTVRVNIA
ncbi:hypothetical protein NW755_012190 [Fusarium falciforme]|uniref:Heterokaryon incompatibility domain-containing protein n=1 Tax=Fusarium falciforme TaxID=195108 RepID=A0A9W8QUY7_9HYPO|nr:hypothetical protein NW755_012190 [Fusarium falciforme]